MTGLTPFAPLETAIAHAESWKVYLHTCQDELRDSPSATIIAKATATIGIAVQLGESLPLTWQAIFHGLLRAPSPTWGSVKESESLRQQIRALFFSVREVLDVANELAENLQKMTRRQPIGMARLVKLIEESRELEANVFKDWTSFAEPLIPGAALSVEESLAEILGISVEEARAKLVARREQLNAKAE